MFLLLLYDNTRIALARLKEFRMTARTVWVQFEFLHHMRFNGCGEHHCHVVTVVVLMVMVIIIPPAVAWILGRFL